MNEKMKCGKKLSDIKLFLIDLDGTVYLEGKLIPGAQGFIDKLYECEIPFVFITNNSSQNALSYIDKLSNLGIGISEKNILTSGQATGAYLSAKKDGAKLFVLGTSSLKTELMAYGLKIVETPDSSIDYVVAGFDTELTYQKLRDACSILECQNIGFVATNPDLVCPIAKKRFIPDCGSICKIIENATGRVPIYIGKPNTTMIDLVKSRFQITSEKIAVIGDRLYTDIALGVNAGIMSICVLSGEASIEEINRSQIKPDIIVSSIGDLTQDL